MSDVKDIDLRDGFDAFTEDMAEHQRGQGKQPTPDANQALAAEEFVKLENQGAFARAAGAAAVVPDQYPRELGRETRDIDGRKYTVTRDAIAANEPQLELEQGEREQTMRILQRLLFLLTLEDSGLGGAPSWKRRVVKFLDKCGGTMGAFMKQPGRVSRELDDLLEDSNRYFGDWRADPERKIFVGA